MLVYLYSTTSYARLHTLYQEQTKLAQEFDDMNDDDIMEMILTVEASIVYYAKCNAVSVAKCAWT